MTCLRKTHTVSKNYFDDMKRVENEILSMIARIKPRTIVDIGVGESTKSFVSSSTAHFISIDVNCNKIAGFVRDSSLDIARLDNLEFVCADALNPPLRSNSADLVILHFVLHEIDPRFHLDILAGVKRVSRYVLIVEPTPNGSELYRRLWYVWREAMRSIGRFEEYREPEYWLQLLNRLNMHIVEEKTISWRVPVPYEVLEAMVTTWIEEWRREGVPERYVHQLEEFLEEAKTKQFRWSDIFAVLALSNRNVSVS